MRIINENPIEGFKAALQSSEQLHELEEYFEIAPKEDIIKLWSKVKSDIQHLVNNLQINRLDSDEKYEESLKNIHAVANAIKIFSTKCKIRTTALIQTVEILVGLLDALSADQSAIEELVKSAISCICEQWFLKTEPSCNQWLPQVITYLLVESLKPSSKESTVKRLCNIKLGFEELDLSTAGADFSKDLLLRCFLHPTFLKSADGMKFLAYLLTISNGYIFESALRVIKSQLLSGGKSISKIYGEMLQKAWKETTNSNESWATDFENYLQDLVHDAVHSADPKYFRGLRLLIKAFHDVKRTDTFEEMLVRVFEPILWRSLRCANATVRSQAAVLFLDVFPLQRINGKPEECDQLLQKQFDQLISLLKDGDHRVRATAISGTFHILREYWDILPGGTVQNILKFIFETLAFDVSSANVRFCVISGIRELLQQPLSHQSLRILLPLIANSIHDKAEKNRLAFVRLLNDVKALRGIHFYEIVSVPHLLERFAEDRKNQEISCAMCQLLLDSFYPQNDSSQPKSAAGKELVARCIQFVEESPLAAEAFYSNLHSHIAMGSVIKLCVMLFHVLHSSILEATKPSKGNKGKRSRNESDEKDFQQPILKDDVVIGFVRVIYALLDSVKHNLAGENFCLELLYKYFTPEKFMAVFNCLLQKYNDRLEVGIACLRLTQALLFIAQCPEGSHFFTACQNLSINYWIQDVAQSLIVKSSNFTIHQEICRIIMDIFFAGNMVVDFLTKVSDEFHSIASGSKLIDGDSLCLTKLLASLVELLCRPQFAATIDDKVTKEVNLVLGSASALIESSILSSQKCDHVLEISTVLCKSICSWAVYQDCSELIANTDSPQIISFDSRPLGLITSWGIELIESSFLEESVPDFNALNCVLVCIVLALTDSFYMLEEMMHPRMSEQVTKLVSGVAKIVGYNEKKRIQWVESPTHTQLITTLRRLDATKVLSESMTKEVQHNLDVITSLVKTTNPAPVKVKTNENRRIQNEAKPSLLMI